MTNNYVIFIRQWNEWTRSFERHSFERMFETSEEEVITELVERNLSVDNTTQIWDYMTEQQLLEQVKKNNITLNDVIGY